MTSSNTFKHDLRFKKSCKLTKLTETVNPKLRNYPLTNNPHGKKILVSLLTLHYPPRTYQSPHPPPSLPRNLPNVPSKKTRARGRAEFFQKRSPLQNSEIFLSIKRNIRQTLAIDDSGRYARGQSRRNNFARCLECDDHRDPRITDTDHLLCITTPGVPTPPPSHPRAKSPCRVSTPMPSKSTRPATTRRPPYEHTPRLHAAITIISII